MRVGISLTSNHPDVTGPRQAARWMIERAAAAWRASVAEISEFGNFGTACNPRPLPRFVR
jgi:hypothetical protein